MKNAIILLTTALILSLCEVTLAGPDEPMPRQLEVVGSGVISATPDIAVLAFTVESNQRSAGDAVAENAKKADTLLQALKGLMGKQDKIQTSGYSVSPIYDRNNRLRPSGYRVSKQVVVETRRIDKVGAFIDAAANAEAGRMNNLQFRTSQEADFLRQAAAHAVAQARQTADVLAKAAGVSIQGVRQIRYLPQGQPVVRFMAEAARAMPQTPIEPGELSLTAQVTMVFAIDSAF
jgi:uncharacterized protein YggE